MKPLLAIVLITTLFPRSGQAQDVPLRAVYETRITVPGGKLQVKRWAFTRRERELHFHDFERDVTERWSRDARGNPSFVRVYHREHTAVRYTSGDLAAYHIAPDWTKLRHLVELPVTRSTTQSQIKHMLGHEVQYYILVSDRRQIEVFWIADLSIPAEIRIRERGKPQRVVRAIELSTDPPAPLDLRMRQIDATDFGDMESDPFVRKHHADALPEPFTAAAP